MPFVFRTANSNLLEGKDHLYLVCYKALPRCFFSFRPSSFQHKTCRLQERFFLVVVEVLTEGGDWGETCVFLIMFR